MPIQDKYYVTLKGGKAYPTWPGVLDAAAHEGLRSLTTELIQAPTAENDHVAIVKARAVFQDDVGERVFEDVGDASPRNTTALVSTALIRMASTRAKGRVLRDGINLGETLAEEIPSDEPAQPTHYRQPERVRHDENLDEPSGNGHEVDKSMFCQECGEKVTPSQRTLSIRKFGTTLCLAHQQGKKVLAANG